jgi:hypothetical protein
MYPVMLNPALEVAQEQIRSVFLVPWSFRNSLGLTPSSPARRTSLRMYTTLVGGGFWSRQNVVASCSYMPQPGATAPSLSLANVSVVRPVGVKGSILRLTEKLMQNYISLQIPLPRQQQFSGLRVDI